MKGLRSGHGLRSAADFELLLKAHEAAKLMGLQVKSVTSSRATPSTTTTGGWRLWAEYGSSRSRWRLDLYTLAAKFKVKALSISR
jgi:purine-nucleoside phosphorylase